MGKELKKQNFKELLSFRVRYSETDRMGAVYNSRVLEWFEMGRTEFMRLHGFSYRNMENAGVFLPVIEAYVRYKNRATYDDLLVLSAKAQRPSPLRLRFDVTITHKDGGDVVASGHTVHAITGKNGRVIRPPHWLRETLDSMMGKNPGVRNCF